MSDPGTFSPRSCSDCREGMPHTHVHQSYEVGPDGRRLVTEFELVDPPEEVAEWRAHKKGRARRPRRGDDA